MRHVYAAEFYLSSLVFFFVPRFAHFDGQWIARQMELHEGKTPLLLVAGDDDLDMCELSLDQTGLTRRSGAEITRQEYEVLWTQFGGSQQVYQARIYQGQ
jgi:myosin-6